MYDSSFKFLKNTLFGSCLVLCLAMGSSQAQQDNSQLQDLMTQIQGNSAENAIQKMQQDNPAQKNQDRLNQQLQNINGWNTRPQTDQTDDALMKNASLRSLEPDMANDPNFSMCEGLPEAQQKMCILNQAMALIQELKKDPRFNEFESQMKRFEKESR